jgi:hypothetical protein
MIDIPLLIQERLPNLHSNLYSEIEAALLTLLPCTKKDLLLEINSFKKKNNIIACGKFTKRYWTNRGWSSDDALRLTKENPRNKTNLSSPMQLSHWKNKINPNTGFAYTDLEAQFKVKSQRKLNIEYWINLGYSIDEAKMHIKEYQSSNGNKWSEQNKKNPEKYSSRTWVQVEYWQKKGHDYNTAKGIVSSLQNKCSRQSFISRHGEELGSLKYQKFIEKSVYAQSLDYFTEKYGKKDGLEKYKKYIISKSPSKTSKESLRFFIPIYKHLRNLNYSQSDIYWGIGKSKEYFIYDTSTHSIFFYDFCIPKLKKIIEYHGTSFHPNPNWSSDKFNDWSCIFSNMSADKKLEFDQYKEKLVKDHGFDVLCVYSDSLPSYETIINFLIK